MLHSFTVQVAGIGPRESERYEDALFEAGCGDALVVVVDDVLFVDFDREAESFDEAVRSARNNIEQAGGKVVEVKPLPAP